MIKLRAYPAIALLVTGLFLPASPSWAVPPDYKLGDVAVEDVVTPVQLLIVNPDTTETLKREVSDRVPAVVRRTVSSTAEAEAELRASLASTRLDFLDALRIALGGREPGSADAGTSVYLETMRDFARAAPKNLPLASFAPLWVNGASDEGLVESLLPPLREVMAEAIMSDSDASSFPPAQPVRLIQVQSTIEAPSLQELESFGVTMPAGKMISLSNARRLVENHFPAPQDELGRFASAFIRTNAYPAPGLTEILRVRRMDGITVSDTYEAAQVVVKRGQTIDRRALGALAAMREKNLIGTLQTKLDQEQTVAGQLARQTKWIAVGFGGICVGLFLILRRLRSRPSGALVPVAAYPAPFMKQPQALLENATQSEWRNRALVAEAKAEQARQAMRMGVMGWMREKVFQTLFHQRSELLLVHQKAEGEMREFEQRLERLHTALQGRITAYEKRIEELERDLAVKGEENRELIGARINVAKQRLNGEREQFGSN